MQASRGKPSGSLRERTSVGLGSRRDRSRVSVLAMFRFADRLDVMLILGGTIAAIVNGAGNAALSILIGDIYDALNSPDPARSKDIAVAFVYVGIALFALTGFQVSFFTMAAERMTLRMRRAYLKAILSQDIAYFDAHNTGALTSQMAESYLAFREALGEKLGLLIQYVALFLRGLIVGFVYVWELCLVIIALTPLLGAAGYITVKTMHRLMKRQMEAYSDAGAIAEETLAMIRTVTAFNLQRDKIAKYETKARDAARASSRQGLWAGLGFGVVTFIYYISMSIALWTGTVLVGNSRESAFNKYPPMDPMPSELGFCKVGGVVPAECSMAQKGNITFEAPSDVCSCPLCRCGCFHTEINEPIRTISTCTTGGDIVLTLIVVMLGSQALGQIMGPITVFVKGQAAAATLYKVIDREPHLNINCNDGLKLDAALVKGEIIFEDVSFSYPSRLESPVFRNLNLRIPAGKRVALVGESGSGKSTCVALLERYYDPDSGRILLDGQDLRSFNIKSLRSIIGLVSQEPILFGTSILENVRYGNPDATDDDVIKACKESNAHGFITSFPDGYQTHVTSSLVSGGQKQRVAIARALLRNPPILLLDEATAALDNESERLVNEAIDTLLVTSSGARTTIVIAHRLSSIRACDRIYVLDKGSLVEEGSHNELIAADGLYAALNKASEAATLNVAANEPHEKHTDMPQQEQFSEKVFPSANAMGNATNGLQEMAPGLQKQSSGRVSLGFLSKMPSATGLVGMQSQDKPMGMLQKQPSEKVILGVMTKIPSATGLQTTPSSPDENENESSLEEEESDDAGIVDVGKSKRYSIFSPFRYAWPDRLYFIPAILGAIVNGAMMPVFVYFFAALVDSFFFINESDMRREASKLCLAYLGMALVGLVAVYMHTHAFHHIAGQMTKRARVSVFQHIVSMEIGFFDEKANNVGALTSRLASDAAMLKAAICDRLGAFTMNITTIIAGYVVAMTGSWKVALVVTALFPALILAAVLEFKATAGVAKADVKVLEDATHTLSESIAGIRTVAAFDMQSAIEHLYYEQLVGPMRKAIRKGFYAGLGFSFAQALPYFFYGAAFWFGSDLVLQGEITFRSLNQALLGIIMTAFALGSNSTYTPDLTKGYQAVQRIFSLLERKSMINAFSDQGARPSVILGDITFENIQFSYPTRPNVNVLDRFNLDIKRGQTVAFVGSSGSGKSTLVLLVERFYDPREGIVRLDGQDIRGLDLEWLRDQIGIVSQEPALFKGTIMENIRAGKLDATDEEVIQAAKAANAHNFITAFPQGYQTDILSSSGVSGGQKQRIAIARALVRNPKILLLDEATSALDEESQKLVQQALDELLKGSSRTTIVVAHRLSTIRNADHIVVLQHGIVAEQGSFEHLVKKGGAFKSLLHAQESH